MVAADHFASQKATNRSASYLIGIDKTTKALRHPKEPSVIFTETAGTLMPVPGDRGIKPAPQLLALRERAYHCHAVSTIFPNDECFATQPSSCAAHEASATSTAGSPARLG